MKKTLFLFLVLYITSLSASAANDDEGDRWFEVEILIFSQQDDTDAVKDNEIWPEMATPAAFAQSITLAPARDSSPSAGIDGQNGSVESVPDNSLIMPYQILQDSELALTGLDNKLSRSGSLVPLYHIAWRQPVFSRDSAAPVYIQWGKQAPGNADLLSSEEALIAPPPMPITVDDDSGDNVSVHVQNLEGSITVSVKRYLHFDVDLFYTGDEAAEKDQNIFNIFDVFRTEDTPRVYRMKQARRMRSGETHYFDHPKFGMIVLITPYEYKGALDEIEEEQETVLPGSTL